MPGLSILLPTFNNAQTISRTLESLKWADEVVVVDSFSTDPTPEICRSYGARVLQHEYVQSAKQKNWAIPQCRFEWVLQLDSDEGLEGGANEEIREVISSCPKEVDAFRMPRKNHVLGTWLRVENLYPDHQTRLFRRDVGRFEDKEVHAHVHVPGQVRTLNHHLLHYGMETLSKQLSNLDRYSRYQADEMQKRGERFNPLQVTLRPLGIFGFYYFLKLGFTSGYRGFMVAAISTTLDFWSHAKLWELEQDHSADNNLRKTS